jgi:hypothetical protein
MIFLFGLPVSLKINTRLGASSTEQGHSSSFYIEIVEYPEPFPVFEVPPLAGYMAKLGVSVWG